MKDPEKETEWAQLSLLDLAARAEEQAKSEKPPQPQTRDRAAPGPVVPAPAASAQAQPPVSADDAAPEVPPEVRAMQILDGIDLLRDARRRALRRRALGLQVPGSPDLDADPEAEERKRIIHEGVQLARDKLAARRKKSPES
jgi:hypothetical protein